MNYGPYPNEVVTRAVGLMQAGTARRDVIDILHEEYGYEKLNRRTLDRWLAKYPYGKGRPVLPKGLEHRLRDIASQAAECREAERDCRARMEVHRTILLESLEGLRGIGVFPLHHFDLALWVSRPSDPCWPIGGGFMCRGARGHLTVCLDVEKREKFGLLRQHLPQDSLWPSLRVWKRSMSRDISARIRLLKGVVRTIERPAPRGGLGLPVIPDMGFGGTPEPAISPHYAFGIYDQALSLVLGLRSDLHGPGDFTRSTPEIIDLEGRPAISAEDPTLIAQVKDFLYRAEAEWVGLPETRAAADTYRQAEEHTEALNAHRERVQSLSDFPSGSRCAECRPWATHGGRGTLSSN